MAQTNVEDLYVVVPPQAMPPLQASGSIIYKEVIIVAAARNPAPNRACGAKDAWQKFSFAKALSGIKSEEGSAVASRGDGAFEDGSRVKAM